jgi:hypothetical protein
MPSGGTRLVAFLSGRTSTSTIIPMQAYTCIICLRLAFRMACDSELLAVRATRSCLYPDRRLLQGAEWTCCTEVLKVSHLWAVRYCVCGSKKAMAQ